MLFLGNICLVCGGNVKYKIFSFFYKDNFYVVRVTSEELAPFLKVYRKNRLKSFVYDPKDKPISYSQFIMELEQ